MNIRNILILGLHSGFSLLGVGAFMVPAPLEIGLQATVFGTIYLVYLPFVTLLLMFEVLRCRG